MQHKKINILLLILLFSTFINAQKNENVNILPGKIINGDTIFYVVLKDVYIFAPYKFKTKRARVRYSRFVRNIKITLPYARLAKQHIDKITTTIDTIKSEKEKKKYIKKAEKELFKEFEKPLRRLTFSQGRMLIKLIDRETGDTSYKLIKDLKGGFSAFMWQSVARIFGSNLKSEYDEKGDDALIEQIIHLIDIGAI